MTSAVSAIVSFACPYVSCIAPSARFTLALELASYVAGRSSETLFYLAAEVFSIPDNAIFVHELIPNGIQHFNRWNGSRFRCTVKTCTG
jgi:hypothetical protein